MKHILIASLITLLPITAHADDVVRMITVQGQAHRDMVPDMASIDVTVESKNREAATAKKEMDAKLEKLYALSAKMGIDKKYLKTNYALLQPSYIYNEGKQIFEHYHALTAVKITIKDMSKTGELMQALVGAGFDNMGGLQYSVDDEQSATQEVMLEALDNARAKAEKMASRMNEKLGRVLQISEGSAQHDRPQPIMMRAAKAEGFAADAAMAPPAGEQRINATATVSFELKD